MFYDVSMLYLAPSDPRPPQCERYAQGSFRCVVRSVARFESVTSYGVINRVKHSIGVENESLEFYKYILPCQIRTGTCEDDHRCVSDTDAESVTRKDAPDEVTGG